MSKGIVVVGALAALGLACSASSKSTSSPYRPGDTSTVGGSDGAGASSGAGTGATGGSGALPSGVTCTLDGCSGNIPSNGGTTGASGQGGGAAGQTQGQGGGAAGQTQGQGGGSTGVPGTVGSPCNGDTCDPGLMCTMQKFCQPALSTQPGEVAQAVPPPDSPGVPPASPVILFMKGTFDGIVFDVKAYSTGSTLDYTPHIVTIKLTSAMKSDVYVLATKQPYPLGSSVIVTMSGAVTGQLVFDIASKSPPAPTDALGFEPATSPLMGSSFHQLQPGWVGFGDTAVVVEPLVAQGEGPTTVMPSEGSSWAGLTSGAELGGSAVNGQSSILETGPMPGDFQTLSFDYDFHSAELPTYCGSTYDDTAVAVVSGPTGAYAAIVDSVNLVCASMGASPGMPGGLVTESLPSAPPDMFATYGTGRKAFSLPATVGSPAVFALAVTNVGDTSFPSLVAIDNVVVK
jgi:hypothetical protein